MARIYFTGILSQVNKNRWTSNVLILLKNIRFSKMISQPGISEPNGFKNLLINLKDKNANINQYLGKQITIIADTSFFFFYKDADVINSN